jgi:hypothetical protein
MHGHDLSRDHCFDVSFGLIPISYHGRARHFPQTNSRTKHRATLNKAAPPSSPRKIRDARPIQSHAPRFQFPCAVIR